MTYFYSILRATYILDYKCLAYKQMSHLSNILLLGSTVFNKNCFDYHKSLWPQYTVILMNYG